MSDFMKTLLKDFSQNITITQNKMKEINKKFDYESKINLINEIKKKIKEELSEKLKKIETEYRSMSEKLRSEYKSQFENLKNENNKLQSDVEKIETKIKKEFLTLNQPYPISKDESEKLKFLAKKIDDQNQDLTQTNKTQNNIIEIQQNTIMNLNDQGDRLVGINTKLGEIEHNLSLNDQIVGVMANRELFYKFKLFIIVALLFIADIIILYIKMM